MTQQQWRIRLAPQAEQAYRKLDGSLSKHVKIQIEKLKVSPELGKPLGNKDGLNLTGYYKLYAAKKSIRIVYERDDAWHTVRVIAIGKREDLTVYRQAANNE